MSFKNDRWFLKHVFRKYSDLRDVMYPIPLTLFISCSQGKRFEDNLHDIDYKAPRDIRGLYDTYHTGPNGLYLDLVLALFLCTSSTLPLILQFPRKSHTCPLPIFDRHIECNFQTFRSGRFFDVEGWKCIENSINDGLAEHFILVYPISLLRRFWYSSCHDRVAVHSLVTTPSQSPLTDTLPASREALHSIITILC